MRIASDITNPYRANLSWQHEGGAHTLYLGNAVNITSQPHLEEANSALLLIASRLRDQGMIQLWGPTDILALNYPKGILTPDDHEALRAMPYRAAWAIGETLCSYGGLTYGYWEQLDKPETAKEAATRINETITWPHPGVALRTSGIVCAYANPILAHPEKETYPSWATVGKGCPFPQLHAVRNGYPTMPQGTSTTIANGYSVASVCGQYFVGCGEPDWPVIAKDKRSWGRSVELEGEITSE